MDPNTSNTDYVVDRILFWGKQIRIRTEYVLDKIWKNIFFGFIDFFYHIIDLFYRKFYL